MAEKYRDPVKARTTYMRNTALRAVDDPAKLAKAARIVRAALARRVLTLADLRGDIVAPSDSRPAEKKAEVAEK